MKNNHLKMAWLTKSLLEHHMESLSSEGMGRKTPVNSEIAKFTQKIKTAKTQKKANQIVDQLFLDSPETAPSIVIYALKRLNAEKPILSDDVAYRLRTYDKEAQDLEIIKELQSMPNDTLELIRDLSRLYKAVLSGQKEVEQAKRMGGQGVASVLCGTLSTLNPKASDLIAAGKEIEEISKVVMKILSNHPSNPVLPLTSVQSQIKDMQSFKLDELVTLGEQLFASLNLDKEHTTSPTHSVVIKNLRSEFKKQSSIILNSRKPEKEKEALNEVMNIITTLKNFQSYITTLNRKGHQVDGGFANGQEHSMSTNPATQRPASPPPIPAHRPSPVPPERTTSKSSPTDAKPAQAKQSPPLLLPRTGAIAKPSPADAKPAQAKQSPPPLPPRPGITAGRSPTDAKPVPAPRSAPPPAVPPRPGATAKPSPTDAQVTSSTPFLEEAGRTDDAKPKKHLAGAVKVML